MIKQLIENNRRLRIEYNNLIKSCDENDLVFLKIIEQYFSDYCAFYNLSPAVVSAKYQQFIDQYLSDFKKFIETGKYPYELNQKMDFDRVTYDIALILSVFFTPVRFSIFKETINFLTKSTGTILIIGVGAAMELELLDKLFPHKKVDAYDISVSDFVKSRFNSSMLHEKEFTFSEKQKFDSVLIIELLEHLSKPYEFIKNCATCLHNKGILVCTTASNMPQFDHLYNFHTDNFEKNISADFFVTEKLVLKHKLINPVLDSYNTFYILEKIN